MLYSPLPILVYTLQANVLISDEGTPLLCDFGLACLFDDNLKQVMEKSDSLQTAGTLRYMAPELYWPDSPAQVRGGKWI